MFETRELIISFMEGHNLVNQYLTKKKKGKEDRECFNVHSIISEP